MEIGSVLRSLDLVHRQGRAIEGLVLVGVPLHFCRFAADHLSMLRSGVGGGFEEENLEESSGREDADKRWIWEK